MKQVVLVDTYGFFFKSYFALPQLQANEFPTGLLTGFANLLLAMHKRYSKCCVIFALEGGNLKRKEIFKDYKANRQAPPNDLILQLKVALSWLSKMQLPCVSAEGYEADDVIASLGTLANKQGLEVEIISSDKDLYQLIKDNIKLYDYSNKKLISKQECFNKFGVNPSEFTTYQSIVGDASDNIPGIKGIGKKGALNILEHFKSLDELYACKNLEEFFTKRVSSLILEGKENAYLSLELVELKKDLFDSFSFVKSFEENPLLKIIDELEKYELNFILKKLQIKNEAIKQIPKDILNDNLFKEEKSTNFSFKAHLILNKDELFNILNSIPKDVKIAFDTESQGLDVRKDKMVGFSFCYDGGNGYYVPFLHSYLAAPLQIDKDDIKKALEIIYTHKLIGHNIKFDLGLVRYNFNLLHKEEVFDSMILAFLLSPSSPVGLDKLMLKEFDYEMIPFSQMVKKNEHFGLVELSKASVYASEDAVATFKLYERLDSKSSDLIKDLSIKLEFPFIKILQDMEHFGIRVDLKYFNTLKGILQEKIYTLTEHIHAQIGQQVNLNSPKQLSYALYDTLNLKDQGKQKDKATKSGFSTDEDSLTNLLGAHEVIPSILEYREYSKILSTYVSNISSLVDSVNKIHTSFVQTGTFTGRLASKGPNLQNIPVRSQMGKNVRKGFIPTDGFKFLSIDYSQIELRLLAHFSQDASLIFAFQNDLDIHLEAAKNIFGDELASKNRHIAKSINFGLIYGMGASKLSKILDIPQKQAKEYIDKYFSSFSTVKKFLEDTKNNILESGYITTLLGRKRYFNFNNISDFAKANFLREGVNAIFQGSAADLIKISMNAIYNKYKDDENIKMLLQIHDELIFEIKEDILNNTNIAKELEDIMNNAYKLRVPLRCGVQSGDNWAMLK